MKKKKAHIKKILKTAVLAGIVGLSLAAFVPAVQAESPVNEFAQRVHDEMNSNSPFMQELRRYVDDAQAAHRSGTDYGTWTSDHAGDYPELAGFLDNTNNALQDTGDSETAIAWGAIAKVGQDLGSDENSPYYELVNSGLGPGYGTTAPANGRIVPGSSTILGSQTINGDQIVTGNSAIGGNQTIDGHLWVGNGIDANNHKITGVADGEISPTSQDAVNGRQLYHVNRRIDHLRNRVNRIGAGAAALAALQPLPYSPDQKWSIATGYGHYQDANATALGAYYYPNENIMVSMGTAFGNGENMVNAGLSLRLGPSGEKTGNKVSSGEIEDLKKLVHEQGELIQKQGAHIEEQDQRMAALEKQNAELLEKLEQIVK